MAKNKNNFLFLKLLILYLVLIFIIAMVNTFFLESAAVRHVVDYLVIGGSLMSIIHITYSGVDFWGKSKKWEQEDKENYYTKEHIALIKRINPDFNVQLLSSDYAKERWQMVLAMVIGIAINVMCLWSFIK